ncbi:phosphatase PAP2 family protein [Larkinella bovis]|uniref:Phosphatase PAP2 family protein n=1 Tax=Larkinella bovis TaxID=683041 RepID=A0ABW0I824_9BACT
MKIRLTLAVLLIQSTISFAQPDSLPASPYRIHRSYELAGSGVLLGASYFGFRKLDRVATLDAAEVAKLNPVRINAFDRPIASLNPAGFETAQKRSDLFLNLSIASPLLLLLSKPIRHDALDLLGMYATAHVVNNLLYFGTAFSIRRARPLTYNALLPLDQKTGPAKSNSFYSGHVSFSTTATFFGAKVLTDYYRIRGWKRAAIFSVAAVPPILVGVNRMKAGKHFPTDVLTGFLIGAACGIGVPEWHKFRRKTAGLAFRPEVSFACQRGLAVTYSF